MKEKCIIILLGAGLGKRFSKNKKNKIEKQYYPVKEKKNIFELCIENIKNLNLGEHQVLPTQNCYQHQPYQNYKKLLC